MALGEMAALETPRQARRLDVRLTGSLRERGNSKFEIDVLDMSVTGCRLETSFLLNPGTKVWITIPGLSALEAEITWRRNYCYGCRFTNLLHAAVLIILSRGSARVPEGRQRNARSSAMNRSN